MLAVLSSFANLFTNSIWYNDLPMAFNLARDWDIVRTLDLVTDLDLTATFDLTSDLANALNRAFNHARASAKAPDLTHARIRNLDRINANNHANNHARALHHDLTKVHADEIDRAHVLARRLSRARANAEARARSCVRNCARDISRSVHEITYASDFVRARTLARDLDFACAHATALVGALDRACDLARDITNDLADVTALDRAFTHALANDLDRIRRLPSSSMPSAASADIVTSKHSGPGRVIRSVVALAVWLQPVTLRPRYRGPFPIL
jgi:hypothetical protein